MKSRGSYVITSTEEGKAAQLDQSYRSCLMALIIFFFLCIILILSCVFAQKSGKSYPPEEVTAMSQTGGLSLDIDEPANEPPGDDYDETYPPEEDYTTTESSQFPPNRPSSTKTYSTSTEQPNITPTSPEKLSTVNTDQPTISSETSSPTSDKSTTSTSRVSDSTGEMPILANTVETSESTSIESQSTSTESDTLAPGEMLSITTVISSVNDDNSTEATPGDPNSTEETETSTTAGTTDQEFLKNNSNQRNSRFIKWHSTSTETVTIETSNEVTSTTRNMSSIPGLNISTEEGQTTLSSIEAVTSPNEDTSTTDNVSSILGLDTATEDGQTTRSSTENSTKLKSLVDGLLRCRGSDCGNTTPSDIGTDEDQTNEPISLENSLWPNIEEIKEPKMNVCNDGKCKKVASKMLSYMNHESSPCADFYEYACGGLEADYQISEKDLSRRAYETVKRQAEKKRNHPRYARFIRYYDSCLNYDVTYSMPERVRLVKEALEKIGKFYTRTEWGSRTTDFTEVFAKLMKNNWPLLFDIVPDVNKNTPEMFTLTISPRQLVFDNKPIQFPHDPDRCETENEDTMSLNSNIDLDYQYKKYEDCRKNTKRFVTSINQTLSDLRIFDNLKHNGNISQNIELTNNAIDMDIIEGIIKRYSSERQIDEAFRSKNYTPMTLGELQSDRTLINWTQLIRSLTGSDLRNDALLYVYKQEELIEAMNKLEELGKTRPHDLNNALLGLYAHYLYNNFVTPKSPRDLHNHCLYKAVHFMKEEASELYMQSFTDIEVVHMRNVMKNHFSELKKTLQQNIKTWAVVEDQKSLLKKLDHMKMYLPDPSLFKNQNANKPDINPNYFENSMNLMKKYRTMIYRMTKEKPLEQIWRFFASPFESTAQTIYALNLIVIPYGAVEVDIKTYGSTVTKENINYLTLATIGNVIARQIAQNFDKTGIRYLNGFADYVTNNTHYSKYIQCHETLYEDGTDMTVSGVSVHFNVPTLSLNQRLSDIVGLRLARDTLDRLSLETTQPLPWLNVNVNQLFYLNYVQAHCTKAPLTSSYISLHEDPFLPSRIRVYVASNNNKLLSEAWACPLADEGPPSPCTAFPYLE